MLLQSQMTQCAIPRFDDPVKFEFPQVLTTHYGCCHCRIQGSVSNHYHYISTTGPPVRVPPRRIPVHYRNEIEQQIRSMLEQGIIEESSSPWMAPAVFVKVEGDANCELF